jgi:hypothetical protein
MTTTNRLWYQRRLKIHRPKLMFEAALYELIEAYAKRGGGFSHLCMQGLRQPKLKLPLNIV